MRLLPPPKRHGRRVLPFFVFVRMSHLSPLALRTVRRGEDCLPVYVHFRSRFHRTSRQSDWLRRHNRRPETRPRATPRDTKKQETERRRGKSPPASFPPAFPVPRGRRFPCAAAQCLGATSTARVRLNDLRRFPVIFLLVRRKVCVFHFLLQFLFLCVVADLVFTSSSGETKIKERKKRRKSSVDRKKG